MACWYQYLTLCQAWVLLHLYDPLLQLETWEFYGQERSGMVNRARWWHILCTGASGRAAELCGVLQFSRKPPVKEKA